MGDAFCACSGLPRRDLEFIFNAQALTPERMIAEIDEPYILILPSYTEIAAYHKKLAPELLQDPNRRRQEVRQWVMNTYWPALNKGDAMTPQERQSIIDGIARYTGLARRLNA